MKERDIRPRELFAEFLRLASIDADTFFDWRDVETIGCPLCDADGRNSGSVVLFEKYRFQYSSCMACETWFASKRPSSNQLKRWYSESPAAKFWATDFYARTAESRREYLWGHKARYLRDELWKRRLTESTIVDIGGGYGVFAEEFRKLTGANVVVIEPGSIMAEECRSKGLEVVQSFFEDVSPSTLPTGPKVFTCFELFEHLDNPKYFFSKLKALMLPGDLAVFTTLASSGLDISLLGAYHSAVSPPHHLLFANPGSIRRFLSAAGFSGIETETPGRLDLDILYQNKTLIRPGFWREFLETSDETQRRTAQEIVAGLGMSSHMQFSFEASPIDVDRVKVA